MMWVGFFPIQKLVFYDFPNISRSHFISHIIPNLKASLSLTLQHYWAFAGNLILPPADSSTKPGIRYLDGDSVLSLFSESHFCDFDYLTSDKARTCVEFHPLVPPLPQPSEMPSGSRIIPLVALQVTLFPGAGISIGVTNQHAVGDGKTMYDFVKAWADISKLGPGESSVPSLPRDEYLPNYDRTGMKQAEEIEESAWALLKNRAIAPNKDQTLAGSTDKVRATFVIGLKDVERLKKHVLKQQPSVMHLSSFTVSLSYVWTCLVKSGKFGKMVEEDEGNDQILHFIFPVDCRERSDPPIPANYYGNCVLPCAVSVKSSVLMGEGGFPAAAELIGKAIRGTLQKEGGLFSDIETLFSEYRKAKPERSAMVVGSPRHNYYDVDFGWGKARKFEYASIDVRGAISLSGVRDSSGGFEIGMALPKPTMDAFTSSFYEGLNTF